MCFFKRKKKVVDELEEYENNSTQNAYYNYDTNTGTYNSSIEDVCFIASTDILLPV